MEKFYDFSYKYQLNIYNLFERTVSWAPNQEIVYRDAFRYTYADFYARVKKLAKLYQELGISKGDVIGVMDWDSHRYLEHYYAVPMMGAILHTVNVRLSPEQILYTINHAEDKVLVVHEDFLPILKAIEDKFTTVEKIILISEKGSADYSSPKVVGEYESLLSQMSGEFDFDDTLDENTIATLFYTTGTTGDPKGVYFTHRQLVLHTLSLGWAAAAFHEPVSFTYTDVYMPLTPMFHVHAWGVPYVATFLGVKQIYPGRYEPELILKLFVKERVTFSHCVPTILHMVLSHPATKNVDFSGWKVIIGGSALPKGLCRAAWERGIRVTTGYGMSETCPVLTLAQLKPHMFDWDQERKIDVYTKTGFPVGLVKLKVVDEKMNELPLGKQHQGEIVVRAPWLTKGYYKNEAASRKLWEGGWLHTGDVAYKDEEGYVKITDRIKDVIKTGGEWVSSLELENLISQHEAVSEVAVVGVPDPKWGERPVAHIVLKPEFKDKVTEEDFRQFMMKFVDQGVIEKWAVPDRFVFVDAIPKTSVGKIDKKAIRAQYQL
ncbi:fatty acid--CoA ligase [Thermosulfidibacter takaii]|nr:fatty acid--CoA ligase [Thermosulfidibacter takaii]